MPFAYYDRLSAANKRIYRRSDEIAVIELPSPGALRPAARHLGDALRAENRGETESLCQQLADGITSQLGVSRVRLEVLKVRPSDDWGELHGLYEPGEDGEPALVSLWMRTAQLQKVVAYRTFLRTLLHELSHHLDYELFELPETFHTEGFYRRESSLFHQLAPTSQE